MPPEASALRQQRTSYEELPASARAGHFLVFRDPDPDPDGSPFSWVVEDARDGTACSDWHTYADAITEAIDLDRKERSMQPVTPDNAAARGQFSQYRKTATSTISDFTVPAGTPFETPEGLKAEDEECRVAFDVQGGVYPIRESVFRATYERAEDDV